MHIKTSTSGCVRPAVFFEATIASLDKSLSRTVFRRLGPEFWRHREQPPRSAPEFSRQVDRPQRGTRLSGEQTLCPDAFIFDACSRNADF
jgi:hypothetical protein